MPLGGAAGAGAAGLLRGRHDKIAFEQSVSTAGSIFVRAVFDDMDLEEEYSDNYAEAESDDLGFADVAIGQRELRRSASNTMTLTHANTVSGGRVDGGGGGSVTMEAIFDSNTLMGDVVYISGDGHVDLAQADNGVTATAVGVAIQDVMAGGTGEYIPVGPVTCATWSLSAGTVYFLDPSTPGGMTATYPTTPGHFVVILGAAASSTQLNLEIHWMLEQS